MANSRIEEAIEGILVESLPTVMSDEEIRSLEQRIILARKYARDDDAE